MSRTGQGLLPRPGIGGEPRSVRTSMVAWATMFGSSEARALHTAHPAIDLHADTLMWSRWIGYDLSRRHEPPLPRSAFFGHVDLPRLSEGGIGAQFFGLVSLPVSARGPAHAIDEQIDVPRSADRPLCRETAQGDDGRGHRGGRARRSGGRPPRDRRGARARGRSRAHRSLRSTRCALPGPFALQRQRSGLPRLRPPAARRGGTDALGKRARQKNARQRRSSSIWRISTSGGSSTRAGWRSDR